MSAKGLPHEVNDQEDITEENSFDELAMTMADGTLSRSRALKLVGAAVLGGALSFFVLPADEAEAKKRRRKKKRRRRSPPPTCGSPFVVVPCYFDDTTSCRPDVCVCPPGTECAPAAGQPGKAPCAPLPP